MIQGKNGVAFEHANMPRIVIVGAGFGGLSCACALRNADAAITLIDRRNFHLFQPLLYQVATAALSPADIAMPIRRIFRRQKNIRVVLGNVVGVDRVGRTVVLDSGDHVAFDFLVVASGAQHAYFGHEEWERYAPGLKLIEDATGIRRRVLMAFERAEIQTEEDERRRLLTFVIVGAGPTGVEMAGAIAELARTELAMPYRSLHAMRARVVLVEAGAQILPAFNAALASKAVASLQRLGIEVITSSLVEHCDADGIVAAGKRIEARTIVWAAGVRASPAARWLGVIADRAGRVHVNQNLSIADEPNIFVIGDTASVVWTAQRLVPGIAPAAKQEGAFVGALLRDRLRGVPDTRTFLYRHQGDLATIGRKSAVIDFGWLRLSGWLAWVLWSVAHIFFLIGFRNRIMVSINWIWAYFTHEQGAPLITGTEVPDEHQS